MHLSTIPVQQKTTNFILFAFSSILVDLQLFPAGGYRSITFTLYVHAYALRKRQQKIRTLFKVCKIVQF